MRVISFDMAITIKVILLLIYAITGQVFIHDDDGKREARTPQYAIFRAM